MNLLFFIINENYALKVFLLKLDSILQMKRILPLTIRLAPRLFKTFMLGVGLYILPKSQLPFMRKIECFNFKSQDEVDPINKLLSQVVKVCVDGDTLGYAFCIDENILVTASPYLLQKRRQKKKLQFYIKDFNIQAEYDILGHFQNLTFIKINQANRKILPMPSIKPTERIPITSVQVVQKRQFLSIKDGYIVSKQSGFGIVDGKGEVGSLVIANGRAAGIVTSIGRDSERGFMRMVAWGDLSNVLKRLEKLQKDQLYLGISAAALEERDGLAIARVTPVSPFANKLMMGDIILKANNQTITHTDDLKRIIMFSGNQIVLTIERQGKNIEISFSDI